MLAKHKQIVKQTNKQSKSTTINQVNVNGTDITGDVNVAEEFNDFFCSIGPKLANNIPPTNIDHLSYMTPVSTSFDFQDITNEELRSAIKNMKTSKSPGLDKISVKLLKEADDTIIPSLAFLFNLSLCTAVFPDDWKFSRVTPIYTSGEKADCGNYRPISIISTIAKIFEKLVYREIVVYLNENNVISSNQSGFRSLHSTETALLGSTNQWLMNMDLGLINGVSISRSKKSI